MFKKTADLVVDGTPYMFKSLFMQRGAIRNKPNQTTTEIVTREMFASILISVAPVYHHHTKDGESRVSVLRDLGNV